MPEEELQTIVGGRRETTSADSRMCLLPKSEDQWSEWGTRCATVGIRIGIWTTQMSATIPGRKGGIFSRRWRDSGTANMIARSGTLRTAEAPLYLMRR